MKNFKFNGKFYGINITYYENGKLVSVINDKRKEGYIKYYVNGNILEKCYYKNDKIEGECIEYYDNGDILIKSYYKNGKRVE
jgi:antitoxin component YwqK of YwqJK toxin-antitoxin module